MAPPVFGSIARSLLRLFKTIAQEFESMETTLHHQLKEMFREPDSEIEVKLGRFRIDVVNGNRLVEIQRSSLASIRDKIKRLLQDGHRVDVIKPIVTRKRLIKLSQRNGDEIDRRWSPLRGSVLDIFEELLYFTQVFPHPNLNLIIPLMEIEEIRYPGHGRRRRKRDGDFLVKDRQLLELGETFEFSSVIDLQRLLPKHLPKQFDTDLLAKGMCIPRHQAQRIAYVMRKTGGLVQTGKQGNAIQYRLVTKSEAKRELLAKRPKRKACLREALDRHRQKAA